jgi:hypothetical protein
MRRSVGLVLIIAAFALFVGCRTDPIGPNSVSLNSARAQTVKLKDMANNRTGHTATLISDTANETTVLFVGGGGSACNRELYRFGRGSDVLYFESVCRIDHTATKLSDGGVLIAGGQSSLQIASETLSSAEIFSPSTTNFAYTGNLTTARYGQNAILLNDGTVLITGGFVTDRAEQKKTSIASAELYDPRLGQFSLLPDMNYPRAAHSTTLLDDGSVLVIGGTIVHTPIERYLPTEKRFESIESTEIARSNHSSTMLMDGKVLIAGGVNESSVTLADAVLFDPKTESYSATGLMNVGRTGHTASMLSDGSVALVGGNGADQWALASIEIYDPVFREFSMVSYLSRPRTNHTATFIASLEGVLVAGGWGRLSITGPIIMRDIELFSTGAMP